MGGHFIQRTWGIQNMFNLELIRKVVKIHRRKKKCFYANCNLNLYLLLLF